ncbi:MAG: thioredoxin domain-containing protein [Firmicutes bacterium]|nr:thioredoxin domain-containing protein [Bacillota bacterium]
MHRNHLINENSPYLLQHAHQPVDWYPWGEDAFARARQEDKPVFVSIGYSTCHWCHMMAEESFSDPEIAALLNRDFISVKVDREERPDVDSVYMSVCQAMTGSGGWPMSIFMTWDKRPFFAGTYFPKDGVRGMIGFRQLLEAVADKWREERQSLLEHADGLVSILSRSAPGRAVLDPSLPEDALEQFKAAFDPEYGGFGPAPKFPSPHHLLFLLDRYRRQGDGQALRMAEVTLKNMYHGGVFDHIGFGFSRYSVDRAYQVPHFEKMLYDNTLLIMAYAKAAAVSGNGFYLRVAREIADYLQRELMGPEGEFFSAQDADSEGEEGRFYTFTPAEIKEVLGERDGEAFNRYYGISEQGNFAGRSIPHLSGPEDDAQRERLAQLLPKLREYRRQRSALLLDDKVLTAWNSLTVAALTRLYRTAGEYKYLEAARACNGFILAHLQEGDRLFVSWRQGKRGPAGFLDDYACLIWARLELHQATQEQEYLRQAELLCRRALADFSDPEGGFYLSGRQNEQLILRPKETWDGALPGGNSVMAFDLVRLAAVTDDPFWRETARRQLGFMCAEARRNPMAHAFFLLALTEHLQPPERVTVVPASGDTAAKLLPRLREDDLVTLLPAPTPEYPLLNGETTYYRCNENSCLPPSNRPRPDGGRSIVK